MLEIAQSCGNVFTLSCFATIWDFHKCSLIKLDVIPGWGFPWDENLCLFHSVYEKHNMLLESSDALVHFTSTLWFFPLFPCWKFWYSLHRLKRLLFFKIELLKVTLLFSFPDQRWFPGSSWCSTQSFTGELFASVCLCVCVVNRLTVITMFSVLSCFLPWILHCLINLCEGRAES